MTLRDPALHAVVCSLLRRDGGGEDLLVYRTKQGWHDVSAEDINARLKELAGAEFSAKDLRTLDEVAEHLGNTRAVTRASYVDPRVLEHYVEGRTILAALRRAGTSELIDEKTRAVLERALLRLLHA